MWPWSLQITSLLLFTMNLWHFPFVFSSLMTSPSRHLPSTFYQRSLVLVDLAMLPPLPYLMLSSQTTSNLTYWWHWAPVIPPASSKQFLQLTWGHMLLLGLVLTVWACMSPCQNVSHNVSLLSTTPFSGSLLSCCESPVIILPPKSLWALRCHGLSDPVFLSLTTLSRSTPAFASASSLVVPYTWNALCPSLPSHIQSYPLSLFLFFMTIYKCHFPWLPSDSSSSLICFIFLSAYVLFIMLYIFFLFQSVFTARV